MAKERSVPSRLALLYLRVIARAILGVRVELALKSAVGSNHAFEGSKLGAPVEFLEHLGISDFADTGRGLNGFYPTRTGATDSSLMHLKQAVLWGLRKCAIGKKKEAETLLASTVTGHSSEIVVSVLLFVWPGSCNWKLLC